MRLVCDEHLHAFLLKSGFAVCARIALNFPENSLLPVPDLSPEFMVQSIDTIELLERCTWYEKVLGWYETAENFLKGGFGFALINKQGVIVAKCYGAYSGKGLCEIGIVTHPEHYGKGYATLIARYALVECQKRNLKL